MHCAISGQPPEDPVVSSKSGHLFERRIIEKYIDTTHTCPITNEPLSKEDLIAVKATDNVKPRPPAANSIPGMLALLQNEWDACMLETFTLKQHLETVRQELAHALYQHDAACRVIARLIKERDQARAALGAAVPAASATVAGGSHGGQGAGEGMDVELAGLSPEVVAKIVALSTSLAKERKKKKNIPGPEKVDEYSLQTSNALHKSTNPGILSMSISPSDPNTIATGGVDHNVIVFNKGTKKVASTLDGHTGKVTSVLFHSSDDVLFSASSDKTCRIWQPKGRSWNTAYTLSTHTGPVTGLSLHPTGDYIAMSSLDKSWSFTDIRSGTGLLHVAHQEAVKGFASIDIHPDGLLLATGTEDAGGLVRIWDVKAARNEATFEGHANPVVDVQFSENGYYLASLSSEACKVWDLRKLVCIRTIHMDQSNTALSLDFDNSRQYLAIGGNDIQVYNTKSWDLVNTFSDHSAGVTSVRWAHDGSFLASASLDRTLKTYA